MEKKPSNFNFACNLAFDSLPSFGMPLDMHKSYQFGTRLGVQFNMQFGMAFDTHKVLNNLI